MADCSKYTVEEAGFDISALKTSLIQYFRCRREPSDHCSPPPRISELQRDALDGDIPQSGLRLCPKWRF
ncbi:hypothetical protein PBY51_006048 [Eleginops maclovinus]|uniref:Uncharacterized protein n=1 Tax=Eleginops maclovinus TaxID=56733 RepID=A0AAN7WEB5_ELEMC|nr:hypothetical protein PBY51_006048 [Eleginops maclovinus]